MHLTDGEKKRSPRETDPSDWSTELFDLTSSIPRVNQPAAEPCSGFANGDKADACVMFARENVCIDKQILMEEKPLHVVCAYGPLQDKHECAHPPSCKIARNDDRQEHNWSQSSLLLAMEDNGSSPQRVWTDNRRRTSEKHCAFPTTPPVLTSPRHAGS